MNDQHDDAVDRELSSLFHLDEADIPYPEGDKWDALAATARRAARPKTLLFRWPALAAAAALLLAVTLFALRWQPRPADAPPLAGTPRPDAAHASPMGADGSTEPAEPIQPLDALVLQSEIDYLQMLLSDTGLDETGDRSLRVVEQSGVDPEAVFAVYRGQF